MNIIYTLAVVGLNAGGRDGLREGGKDGFKEGGRDGLRDGGRDGFSEGGGDGLNAWASCLVNWRISTVGMLVNDYLVIYD